MASFGLDQGEFASQGCGIGNFGEEEARTAVPIRIENALVASRRF
jgi:hypothetical protein